MGKFGGYLRDMKKVLIIRFSSIGDIVLTTPVLRTLYRQLPAEIHVLTKRPFASLLEANPYVHQIHVLDGHWNDLMRKLKEEKFDIVVDLHKNLRSMRVRRALGKPAFSYDKRNFAKWLLVRFGWNFLDDSHLVDRYFEGLHSLGIVNDQEGLDYFIPPGQEVDVQQWLGSNRSYCAVVLGAAHATKQIPIDKLKQILQEVNGPAILLGGPAEASLGDQIGLMGGNQIIVNLAGKLSLHQSASVIQQAKVVLTPDTGMMHIAAALRKPTVTLWGNTVPAFSMFPLYPKGEEKESRFEVLGLSCRPCSKLGSSSCPKGHFRCMMDQPHGTISETINRLLDT